MFGRRNEEPESATATIERSAEEAVEKIRQAAEEVQEAAEEVSGSRGGRRLIGLVALGILAALIVVWRSK